MVELFLELSMATLGRVTCLSSGELADYAGCPVLTVRQPWASLLVEGVKDVENRSWTTCYRGPLWIHAGTVAADEVQIAARYPLDYPRRVLLGLVDLTAIRVDSESEWAEEGWFHWLVKPIGVLSHPLPISGKQMLWKLPPALLK